MKASDPSPNDDRPWAWPQKLNYCLVFLPIAGSLFVGWFGSADVVVTTRGSTMNSNFAFQAIKYHLKRIN